MMRLAMALVLLVPAISEARPKRTRAQAVEDVEAQKRARLRITVAQFAQDVEDLGCLVAPLNVKSAKGGAMLIAHVQCGADTLFEKGCADLRTDIPKKLGTLGARLGGATVLVTGSVDASPFGNPVTKCIDRPKSKSASTRELNKELATMRAKAVATALKSPNAIWVGLHDAWFWAHKLECDDTCTKVGDWPLARRADIFIVSTSNVVEEVKCTDASDRLRCLEEANSTAVSVSGFSVADTPRLWTTSPSCFGNFAAVSTDELEQLWATAMGALGIKEKQACVAK